MTETAILSAIIIAQFTVLAGMIMYIAQRLERRMDGLDARMDRLDARMDRLEERMDRLEERLRVVELQVAGLIGRLFGEDPQAFESLGAAPDIESAEAPAATT